MNNYFSALQSVLGRWRAEHALVAEAIFAANLRRMRLVCPVVLAFNAVNALVVGLQLMLSDYDAATHQYKVTLLLVHFAMALCMVALTYGAHRLRHASRSFWGSRLPLLAAALGAAFGIAISVLEPAEASDITPFLVCSMVATMTICLSPILAAWLFLVAYAGLFYASGVGQSHADVLLSMRLAGAAACALTWVLALLLWRSFANAQLMQNQLDKAGAELRLKHRELERLTRLDGLTGLFNRKTFVELTNKELERAQRQGSATAIMLLDLDHFKRINDTLGHPAGDAVLKHIAVVASNAVRSTDLVGRLGGEEFIFLLPNTSMEAAQKIAEKLRTRIEKSSTPWEKIFIPVTASIGLSGTTALEKREFDALYVDADKALYIAKQRGRNRVV
jgi:diguanylate cyclase (GGDEF)-like protein